MIYYLNNKYLWDFKKFCLAKDVCAARIWNLYTSYHAYGNIVDFWVQYGENQVISAVSRYGGSMTVYSVHPNNAELREFLQIQYFSSVLSNHLILKDSEIYQVMKLKKQKEISENYLISFDINLQDSYLLLQNSSLLNLPKYEDFILDTSHKLRHETALCAGIYLKNQLRAFAMTTAISESTAVIGSVCVDKDFRRQHLGSICVSALIQKLKDREIFIIREKEKNQEFYQKLGFEDEKSVFEFSEKRGKP